VTPRQLDVAHEFCERVSADDLLDYLGLAADASPDEARAALKARRRKMQGMQSNPKFRDEARLLIRTFQALDAVLGDPAAHVRDMARRRESSHLPILEMTIRGVLTGGPLTAEQEAYLRANAAELGVSAGSFDALLRRLQVETQSDQPSGSQSSPTTLPGISGRDRKDRGKDRSKDRSKKPAASPPPEPKGVTGSVTPRAPDDEAETLLADLGLEPTGSSGGFQLDGLEEIDLGGPPAASSSRSRTADSSPGRSARPGTADSSPGRSALPGTADRSSSRTRSARTDTDSGNRARVKKVRDKLTRSRSSSGSDKADPDLDEDTLDRKPSAVAVPPPDDAPSLTSAATAPPVRRRSIVPGAGDDPSTARREGPPRSIDDGLPGGMEIVGPTRHTVELLGRKPAEVTIRVRLLGELPVAARVVADDPWLSAEPDRLSPTRREHNVHVTVHPEKMFKDEDESTVRLFNDLGEQVEVVIAARRSVNWNALFVGVAAVLAVVVLGLAAWWVSTLFTPNNAELLVVNVYPYSEFILLDGEKIGTGTSANLEKPVAGEHKLTVVQNNFQTDERTIVLGRDASHVEQVKLELSSPLTWLPSPNAERGTVDPASLGDLPRRMRECVSKTPRNTPAYDTEVRILIKADGTAGNVKFYGASPVPAAVQTCLRDQGATVQVPSIADGDYAVITIDVAYP